MSTISAMVESVKKHTLDQLKRRDVCSEVDESESEDIVLSGDDVCVFTSLPEPDLLDIEKFALPEVVLNYDVDVEGKKSLRTTLDLHKVVERVYNCCFLELKRMVIKDEDDLLIKLSISTAVLQQDVITFRLKNALVNKWYKKLQIIFDDAPMEIDDSLDLKPSFFISDKKNTVITSQDIEEENKIIISKKTGQLIYLHDKYDMYMTNIFDSNMAANESFIIQFKDFFKVPKMGTLSIRFIDKEILLSNEWDKINNSDSIHDIRSAKGLINLQENCPPLEIADSRYINVQGKLDRTFLHLASEAGDWDKVKFLLDEGANIELQDEFGYTPIFLAVQSGKWSIVKLLLDYGANIDAQDKKGYTPLHFAIPGNNLDMFQFLLDRGANTEIKDNDGSTLILFAAQAGEWDIVKLLIGNGAKFNNETTYQGTPLHFVQEDDLDMIRFLLDKGAYIESQDKDKRKPLHLAARTGKLNMVKLLLDRGASVNALDANNQTPLHLAAVSDKLDIFKLLLDKNANIKATDANGNTPLHIAAKYGNFEMSEFILDRDTSFINDVNNNDSTPLHLAIQVNEPNIVKLLLNRGANIEMKDRSGRTPLDLAVEEGYTNIVQMIEIQDNINKEFLKAVQDGNLHQVMILVGQNANIINTTDIFTWTPLHWTAYKGHLKIAEFLITNGAGINFASGFPYGDKPIHIAAENNHKYMVEFLLNNGADINDTNEIGYTPLHLSAKLSGRLEIAKLLVAKGANINISAGVVYTRGEKPVHVAAKNGNADIIEFLLSKGASVDDRDKYGSTPLHWAALESHLPIVKFLVNKGANINAENMEGKKPIHSALEVHCYKPIVEFLLSKGVSVDDIDYGWTRTPLHWASYIGCLDVVQYLIDKGANINAKDKDGKTPLDLAVELNNFGYYADVVEFFKKTQLDKVTGFVSQGANVGAPLNLATNQNYNESVEYLKSTTASSISIPHDDSEIQRKRQHDMRHYDYNHLSRKPLAYQDLNDLPRMLLSNANQKSSWIHDLFGWVKRSIGGLFNSTVALHVESEKISTSNISQVIQMDISSTIMLLDLLIRKVTGQIYISSADENISSLEAQSYALNITDGFKKIVEQAAKDNKISKHRLDVNFIEVQQDVTRKIIAGKFNEISMVLKSYVEKACPGREIGCPGKLSPKKFDKFMTTFNNNLDVALNQSMQQMLYSERCVLDVDNVEKQKINLETKSYLNDTSVQDHLTPRQSYFTLK